MITYHSIKKQADSLANYLPGGLLWVAKKVSGSVLRRFLEGLAPTLQETEQFLATYQDQFLPDVTIDFIEDWERVVGIPDGCFSTDTDLNSRRAAIIAKLSGLSVQTEADFVRVAALFGITVNAVPGMDSGVIAPDEELRFTIVIEYIFEGSFVFPFTFPVVFGSPSIPLLTCLYNNIKPANCQILFIEL